MPNVKIGLIDPPQQEAVEVDIANPPYSGNDDFYFDLQWGHDAIDSPEAWAKGYRGKGVRVAILDTGFDTDHPDLASNINLELSKSFVPGEPLEYGLDDPFSHGTHVAGIVAAGDNGFGTIGVAPEAELVLLKVLGDEGSGDFDWLLSAIVYAANIRADVANMSLGALIEYSTLTKDDAKEILELVVALTRASDYAMKRGTTLIASAGNEATELNPKKYLHLPSDAPGFISISATTPVGWAADPSTNLDVPASYTNYGVYAIDFAAPGGDTLYPGEEICTVGVLAPLTRPCWVFDLVFSTGSNLNPNTASYYWSGGTSMAAPHATGVAALIVGKYGGSLHPLKVRTLLIAKSDDLGPKGKDAFYGFGRVNAKKAVR
jgi:subtilisin family serine protease